MIKILMFVAWTLVAFGCGFGLARVQLCGLSAQNSQQCFRSCAALVLLTPDDPHVYQELLSKVEECANNE